MRNPGKYLDAERARLAIELAAHEAAYPETNALFDKVMAELHAEDPVPGCPACAVTALTDTDRAHLAANGWVQPRHVG